jgi:large conductance mechanosensitive channel
MLKKTLAEFKTFIARGNVIDLAVGVIIGSAMGKIVSSLVDDILMPVIGLVLGGINFASLSLNLKETQIRYGAFLQNVVNFLVIALCVFLFVKAINQVSVKFKKPAPTSAAPPPPAEVQLLTEIRDLLQDQTRHSSSKTSPAAK